MNNKCDKWYDTNIRKEGNTIDSCEPLHVCLESNQGPLEKCAPPPPHPPALNYSAKEGSWEAFTVRQELMWSFIPGHRASAALHWLSQQLVQPLQAVPLHRHSGTGSLSHIFIDQELQHKLLIVCVHAFMCECRHLHAMVHVWRSEVNLRCWSSPSMLSGKGSLQRTASYVRLVSSVATRDSSVFTSHLPEGALGLQMLMLCVCFFTGFWRFKLRSSHTASASAQGAISPALSYTSCSRSETANVGLEHTGY